MDQNDTFHSPHCAYPLILLLIQKISPMGIDGSPVYFCSQKNNYEGFEILFNTVIDLGGGSMFAGHFGVAAVVKSKTTDLPLWSLILSSQLLDIAFIPFSLAGLEKIVPLGDGGYGNVMIYAFYTHSLVGALLLAIIAACLSRKLWGKKSALITGFVVFSHWILDLIVHRPDMPILPGNLGNLPLLGFGLWRFVPASMVIEFLLIAAGSLYYFRYVLQIATPESKVKSIVAGYVMAAFLLLSFVINFL